ncbi:exodeoxyribonuclease III [Kozakia baliensis]|uniref:Exodeoxyribonuclease III n=1 Tax=Kozakia baliensis TaxID=153496 RepID=A0A1D8UUJ0_9PROT|nr:exodeoxyribonuclease III [Kozakia baliensis]AOX17299.1 exodeoxyribonuclease III [Kozakia baliensis]GBR29985.1 exodeoxyribonuclease III [Kozakia baliensis NRIC 0488]GEL63271.1 exodeoxyribonuclease III [Kozakia baliensis]
MSLVFASWNINSIRQREALVSDWLERHQPDVLCLQEIKCEEHQFPAVFAEKGYQTAIVGQKSYNGVAILSRHPMNVTHRRLPGFGHEAARYVEAEIQGIVFGNLYLPNGNSGGETGYDIKLDFFDALTHHARTMLAAERDFILLGDYNVCPTAEDHAPDALSPTDSLVRPESRAAWRRLVWSGLTDAQRVVQPQGRAFTFWDYQGMAFQRDSGLRIDHALLSPRLAERLETVQPDREERAKNQPSDHVPLIVRLQ